MTKESSGQSSQAGAAPRLADALWRIYRRPERPTAWRNGGNLPWDDPAFSERMLREHLDDTHSAASRTATERALQIDWLWAQLALAPGSRVLDLTCGPGLYAVALAERGCRVTGIDFSPASICHARDLAATAGVVDLCTFIECDVRSAEIERGAYDVALFLYGQLAVFARKDATALLQSMAEALRPGGRACIELLDQEKVDKQHGTWWFTNDTGLWGDAPFLNLGERFWDEESALSMERFYTLHLDSGELDEILLCDQTYAVAEMTAMVCDAGFDAVETHPAWGGLSVNDAAEWNVFVARRRLAE